MDGYLKSPAEHRGIICQQTQAQLDLPVTSLEKDFWVCWTLRELFGLPGWADNITFKGGTSLSKCWGLINRFSEDIDIVIDKGFLGFDGVKSPDKALSKKQKNKRLEAMKDAAQVKIHAELMPALTARINASLPESDSWELLPASEEEDRDRQTLLFKYPTAMPEPQSYVRRVVRIELGARSDNEPVEEKNIHPYLFDAFPEVLGPSSFRVRALAPERTFWEKAILLHEEIHRPADKKGREARTARHYYDLWCLITRGIAARAADRDDIFTRAAVHRRIYFNWTWMDYRTLCRGSLRLVPLPEQEMEWRRDYQAMHDEMFFDEVPNFDEVLRVVEDFQNEFNGGVIASD